MTQRFLAIMALMAAALMGSSIVAQAAEVSFGGQMRPRYEYFESNDFNDQTDSTQMINARIRLNTKIKVDEKIGAFIQFQARGVYGAGTGGLIPGGAPGSRNAAVPADGLIEVGLHQAYFTVKDLFNLPVNLKLGRQEVVLDGHRLFGNTGWTQGAQSSDSIRLNHYHGDDTFSYVYMKSVEAFGAAPFKVGGNSGGGPTSLGGPGPGGLLGQGTCGRGTGFAGGDPNDSCDRDDHLFWANLKGLVPNSQVSLYLAYALDQTWNALAGSVDNDMYTIGGRVAGQLASIDYRVEAYYQGGDAEGIATQFATSNGTGGIVNAGLGGPNSGVDRSAFMIGLRAGYTAKNVNMKPGITLWYDYLSGTDLGDVTGGDWNTFDTLYDTGHKYYGFMDTYLNATGADTLYAGLQDLAVKFKMSPSAKMTLKADFHHFRTSAGNDELGNELDLTLIHKYSSNLKISAGYSFYIADDNFQLLNQRLAGSGNNTFGVNDQDFNSWGYLMLDLTF